MKTPAIYQTFQRYRSLHTDTIHALPIVILMPHSACNCRCVMCDIWKGNKHLKQLTEADISDLLLSLKKLGTKQVLLSGGEALLHPEFFRFCSMLKSQQLQLTLLSTGLGLQKHAPALVEAVDEIIVSLDGDEETHDRIRNIRGAFTRLREGVHRIKSLQPGFRITARSVIHKQNFRTWPHIIEAAKAMGLNQVSFLPADTTSTAFNREQPWDEDRQADLALDEQEVAELDVILNDLVKSYREERLSGFIAEPEEKLRQIVQYYGALLGKNDFPFRKCNAPWVSAVVEPDGTVRPCFFHDPVGNIRKENLLSVLNGASAKTFRRELDMKHNETCRRCVCSLYLSAWTNPGPLN